MARAAAQRQSETSKCCLPTVSKFAAGTPKNSRALNRFAYSCRLTIARTEAFRLVLETFLEHVNPRVLYDAPCGDFTCAWCACRCNTDIAVGGWQRINMKIEPFSLGPTRAYLPDIAPSNTSKVVGIWKKWTALIQKERYV